MFVHKVFDMDIGWDFFVRERGKAVTEQDIIMTMIRNFLRRFNSGYDTMYEPKTPGKFK